MPGSGSRSVKNTGTNSGGNKYISYEKGGSSAGYRYTNTNSKGEITGRYFNDGKGHGFYKPTQAGGGGPGYHDNYNTNTRTYNGAGKK